MNITKQLKQIKQAFIRWLLKDLDIQKLIQEEVVKNLNDISSQIFKPLDKEVKVSSCSESLFGMKKTIREAYDFMSESDITINRVHLGISIKNKFKEFKYELSMRDIAGLSYNELTRNLKILEDDNARLDSVFLWVNYEYDSSTHTKLFSLSGSKNIRELKLVVQELKELFSKFPELII